MILQADPGKSFTAQKSEILSAVQKVLESGWYILGKEVEAFEENFARFLQSGYCIGTANGTDSIELILRSLGIGTGDKVATVGNTAVATVSAIERCGAIPFFADIDENTLTMSPESLQELLDAESGIKAVIPVHLFGCPANMKELQPVAEKYGIPLLEDCAQAHGAVYQGKYCGTFGTAGAFSFYPTKNLGAFGDGGAVITGNRILYEKCMALRQYGWEKRYISSFSGINSRLDEIQAAILSVKLKYLRKNNQRRRDIAKLYMEKLQNLPLQFQISPEDAEHVYHQFVLLVQEGHRNKLMLFLRSHDVGCAIHYPQPIPLQPAYQNCSLPVSLTNTMKRNPELLSLPIYPEMTDEEVFRVADMICRYFQ